MTLSRKESSRFLAGALAATWRAHNLTFYRPPVDLRRNKAGTPREENFVASFVLRGVPALAAGWTPLARKMRLGLRFAAVYCHSQPKVQFLLPDGTQAGPELADLLVIHRHLDRGGNVERQVASLIQAKMSSDSSLTPQKENPNQFYLLTNWPPFTLRSKTYTVGNTARQGLYAAISDCNRFPEDILDWPEGSPWGTMEAVSPESVDRSFARHLVDMIDFAEGRDFYDPPSSRDDWSALIRFLLSHTFKAYMTPKKPWILRGREVLVGLVNKPLVEASSRGYEQVISSVFGPPGGESDNPSIDQQDENDGAISTIIMETGSGE